MTYKLKVKDKEYELKLTTHSIINLEKAIGLNPLMMFGVDGKRIPTVSELLAVVAASFEKFNHGVSESDVYDIMDAWFDEGHELAELILLVVDIYKASGLIKDKTEKNQ